MGKKRVSRYSLEFRRIAVERMKGCNNIRTLAEELGVERKSLYLWREQLDPDSVIARKPGPPAKSREVELEAVFLKIGVICGLSKAVEAFSRSLVPLRSLPQVTS